jgi:hypothetical protein
MIWCSTCRIEFVDSVILSVFVTAHKRFAADDHPSSSWCRSVYDDGADRLLQVLHVTLALREARAVTRCRSC